jgi:hypothetical protein
MTFVLKELSELRVDFNKTVDILLTRDGKGKIEDLPDPRKYELQFLSAVLTELEKQAQQKAQKTPSAPHSTENQATVYYGAMLTVIKDINETNGYLAASTLRDRLNEVITPENTPPEDKPNLYQTSKFYTTLNGFLKQVFINRDSRKGFASEHMLRAVPTESLSKLMQTSYELEKKAQFAIIASLTVDGKSSVNVTDYEEERKSPISATERFGDFAKLNAAIDKLIIAELADKNVHKIEKLSQHRAAHLHLINITRENLKTAKIDESEKVAVLAGIMRFVREQIIDEYASSYIGNIEKSVVYKGLSKILGADEVGPQDTEALLLSATQFIRFMAIEPESNDKKAIRAKHIYSGIAGFDLKTSLNKFVEMIYNCREEALKHAVEEFKKQDKPAEKQATSYLGAAVSALGAISLFSRKKAESVDEDDEEEVLEHKSSKSHA